MGFIFFCMSRAYTSVVCTNVVAVFDSSAGVYVKQMLYQYYQYQTYLKFLWRCDTVNRSITFVLWLCFIFKKENNNINVFTILRQTTITGLLFGAVTAPPVNNKWTLWTTATLPNSELPAAERSASESSTFYLHQPQWDELKDQSTQQLTDVEDQRVRNTFRCFRIYL